MAFFVPNIVDYDENNGTGDYVYTTQCTLLQYVNRWLMPTEKKNSTITPSTTQNKSRIVNPMSDHCLIWIYTAKFPEQWPGNGYGGAVNYFVLVMSDF